MCVRVFLGGTCMDGGEIKGLGPLNPHPYPCATSVTKSATKCARPEICVAHCFETSLISFWEGHLGQVLGQQ